MYKRIAILLMCICVITISIVWTTNIIADNDGGEIENKNNSVENWHHWRGPLATGAALNANPPINWSESENIRWKVLIPGMGHATPIIWEDMVFIQTAILGEMPETNNTTDETQSERRRGRRRNRPLPIYKFALLMLNRSDGSIKWEKTLNQTKPHEGIHNDASFASNSPVTDGEHIYAYFGSRGLYCLDFEGNIKWEKDIGIMRKRNTFGEGSCPIIHGDTIVIVQDHEGQSFITALDKHTGDELWRMDRDEVTTWASPIVVDYNGISQVIVPASNRTRSYDITNGDLVWECGGLTRNVIPSPIYKDGHVFVMSGHGGFSIQSINLELASGDITGTNAVDWQYDRDTPYVPSALLSGNSIYFLKRNDNILTALDISSGEVLNGPHRVQGISNVYASIVGAAGRIYIADRKGAVAVLQAGPALEVLAVNRLDETFNASPAIVGSELYLRGSNYLYCISE